MADADEQTLQALHNLLKDRADADKPTVQALLNLLKDKKQVPQELVVSVLALLNELKQAGLDGAEPPPGAPAKDALFELAKIHVSTAAQIAKVNASFTERMVDFLKKRRKAREVNKPSQRTFGIFTKDAQGHLVGDFKLDKKKKPRTFKGPEIVELQSLKPGDAGSFVELTPRTFCVPASEKEGDKQEFTAQLERAKLLTTGRYRGTAYLESDEGCIELIIELKVP